MQSGGLLPEAGSNRTVDTPVHPFTMLLTQATLVHGRSASHWVKASLRRGCWPAGVRSAVDSSTDHNNIQSVAAFSGHAVSSGSGAISRITVHSGGTSHHPQRLAYRSRARRPKAKASTQPGRRSPGMGEAAPADRRPAASLAYARWLRPARPAATDDYSDTCCATRLGWAKAERRWLRKRDLF